MTTITAKTWARWTVLGALVVGLGSCGRHSAADQQGPQGPPPVTVANPMVKAIVDWDDYVGRFEAVESVELRPRVSGYITAIRFRDGQFVRRGQTLFTIDPRPFQAALIAAQGDEARAKATLDLAKTTLARAEKLMADKAISQEELDTARATVAQSQGAYLTATGNTKARKLDVEFATVAAPIGGRISDRKLSVGNYVASGTTVLTSITSLDPIRFVFDGSEAVYLKYQRANREGTRPSSRVAPNPVEVRLQDEPSYRWKGKMDFVDNALDPTSGTIRGRAIIRNPDGFLTPGMFGHARLLGSGAYDGLLIPESAVVTDQTRKIVLSVTPDGTVVPKVVTLGPLVDGLRVVRSGLTANDRIIIGGVQRARPGTKVKPIFGKIVPPAPGTGPDVGVVSRPPAASATAASAR